MVRHAAREATGGRFTRGYSCDYCGKSIGRDAAGAINHYTDDDVCGGSDGPGFMLCGRVRCCREREALSVEERRAAYTRRRAP